MKTHYAAQTDRNKLRFCGGVDEWKSYDLGKDSEELRNVYSNTIIILMGDNGYFEGERQLAGKWLMYDNSLRVPLIIFDPEPAGGGIDLYIENGFVSVEIKQRGIGMHRGGTAMTLEHAWQDWCLAQMARQQGKEDDARLFLKRSENRRN